MLVHVCVTNVLPLVKTFIHNNFFFSRLVLESDVDEVADLTYLVLNKNRYSKTFLFCFVFFLILCFFVFVLERLFTTLHKKLHDFPYELEHFPLKFNHRHQYVLPLSFLLQIYHLCRLGQKSKSFFRKWLLEIKYDALASVAGCFTHSARGTKNCGGQ